MLSDPEIRIRISGPRRTKERTVALRKIRQSILQAVALGLFLTSPGPAAEVRAVRVDQGPKIDGFLSDSVWQSAVPFTQFRRVEPQPNSDPSEKTELRVLYDEGRLFIGILCSDSEPARIAANNMA